MKKDLTEKQDQILRSIEEFISERGFPPTVREIGDRFGITVKGAYDHLKAIEKKGYVRCEQNKSRAIELIVDRSGDIPSAPSAVVPLLGRIAAGAPILAEENVEEYLSFPATALGRGEHFALRVKGESMIEKGIYDGDVAIIKKQNSAENGDIIAALVDDEATLKIFKKEQGKIKLLPANSAYKPLILENVIVLGVLAGVFRKY